MAKGGPIVSMNSALTDIHPRGVHVNVLNGKKSMHVEIVGTKTETGYKLKYKPIDPTASEIMEKNPAKWKKITESVDEFVRSPKNATKLANVAEAAGQNYPKNTRDFGTTTEALRTCYYKV